MAKGAAASVQRALLACWADSWCPGPWLRCVRSATLRPADRVADHPPCSKHPSCRTRKYAQGRQWTGAHLRHSRKGNQPRERNFVRSELESIRNLWPKRPGNAIARSVSAHHGAGRKCRPKLCAERPTRKDMSSLGMSVRPRLHLATKTMSFSIIPQMRAHPIECINRRTPPLPLPRCGEHRESSFCNPTPTATHSFAPQSAEKRTRARTADDAVFNNPSFFNLGGLQSALCARPGNVSCESAKQTLLLRGCWRVTCTQIMMAVDDLCVMSVASSSHAVPAIAATTPDLVPPPSCSS